MNALAKFFTKHEKLAILAHGMQQMPQVECPVTNHFAPGVYIRECFIPGASVIVGKIHKTEHLNILVRGAIALIDPGKPPVYIEAPHTWVSPVGTQKMILAYEDSVLQTVHATTETDLGKLEELLIEPPPQLPLFGSGQEQLT